MSASTPLPKGMTAEEYVAWAMQQPEGCRYELVGGEVFAMAPERAAHARGKGRVFRRLAQAIESSGLDCEVLVDGMAVRVDADTVYEPDALVRCGLPLDDDATVVTDPVIVVEVVSPSSHKRDSGMKLMDYFRIPTVRHYLIVRTKDNAVIHHARDEVGGVTTRVVREGSIRFDPPGLEVGGLFDP